MGKGVYNVCMLWYDSFISRRVEMKATNSVRDAFQAHSSTLCVGDTEMEILDLEDFSKALAHYLNSRAVSHTHARKTAVLSRKAYDNLI